MQIKAKNLQKSIVQAQNAQKKTDYFCLECGGPLRLRRGHYRRAHFYHLKPSQNCKQSRKSLKHLNTQIHIQNILNDNACDLEVPFPEIRRIADIAWHSKKIIFEVQCSSITAEEVLKRNDDYSKLGYRVIWIFHDKHFNQRRFTAAEKVLLKFPFYYTNINSSGNGWIYDQFSLFDKGYRRFSSYRLTIDLRNPIILGAKNALGLSPSQFIQNRLNHWPIAFRNDWIWQYFYAKNRLNFEKFKCLEIQCYGENSLPMSPKKTFLKFICQDIFIHRPILLFDIFLRQMLEKTCMKHILN